jgi:hypothetical protein
MLVFELLEVGDAQELTDNVGFKLNGTHAVLLLGLFRCYAPLYHPTQLLVHPQKRGLKKAKKGSDPFYFKPDPELVFA